MEASPRRETPPPLTLARPVPFPAARSGRRRRAAAGVLAAVAALAVTGVAVPAARAQDAHDLARARRDLRSAQDRAADAQSAPDIDDAREAALAVQADADKLAAGFGRRVAADDVRTAQLTPAAGAPVDDALRATLRGLADQRAAEAEDAKAARAMSDTAGQLADGLAEQRRELFNARLFQRSASPLSPELWEDIDHNLPRDVHRLRAVGLEAAAVVRRAAEPRAALVLGAALLLALALLGPVRGALEASGRRRAVEDAPASGLRRSGYAAWMILVDTLAPTLAAAVVRTGAGWAGLLAPGAGQLATALVWAIWWGAFVTALGRFLLSAERPSWRVAPVSERTAQRFRPYPWVVAVVTGAGLVLEQVNRVAGASLAATVAADCLQALAYSAVAAAALVALGRGRTPLDEAQDRGGAARSSAWSLAALAVMLATVAATGAALIGYGALGYLVAREVFWIVVLAATGLLLLRLVDDLCQALFRPEGWAGRALFVVFGARRAVVDQLGVLTSGALRLLLALGVLSLALAPFGQGGGALLGGFAGVGRGFKVGQVVVSPAALAGAVVALAVGVALVRGFQRWLDTRYLPVTGWDAGVRNSISTAVGYVGTIAAVLWALASAGLGLERIALIASALSVGIGFGLQQVVQNFVSGLILLVERPIKVGDWVSVGGVEGDVRHIRVRATEIQTFDRSTLLVPNSELVTKTVQNKTLGAPLGRVRLDLSIGDPQKVEAARDAVLAACAAASDVLADPEPKVFIDAVTNGAVALVTYAYVAGPRDVFPVRSALYFEVLRRLREAAVPLAGASQSLVLEPGPGLDRLFARPAPAAAPPSAPPPG